MLNTISRFRVIDSKFLERMSAGKSYLCEILFPEKETGCTRELLYRW